MRMQAVIPKFSVTFPVASYLITMMQPETIKQLIEQGIADSEAYVRGDDGTHFEAVIISEQFAGKSRVQQHQLVYRALGEKMGAEIHALSMQTYTPAQWEDVRTQRTR